MTTALENQIRETVAKIEKVNADLDYWKAQGNDFMLKADRRRRAGLRAHLTRLQKRAAPYGTL